MSLHENVTDEEQSVLDILIDEDTQSESAGEGHCMQKRKAVDDVYDNSEQRARVCTFVYVLYMAICLGICFNNKNTWYWKSLFSLKHFWLVFAFILSWDSDYLDFVCGVSQFFQADSRIVISSRWQLLLSTSNLIHRLLIMLPFPFLWHFLFHKMFYIFCAFHILHLVLLSLNFCLFLGFWLNKEM